MTERNHYRKTEINVLKILKALKEAEKAGESFLTVSKLSKSLKMHKWTVSRTIDLYMNAYVDTVTPEGFEDVGLQIKFIRLARPDIDEKQALRFLRLRKSIERA